MKRAGRWLQGRWQILLLAPVLLALAVFAMRTEERGLHFLTVELTQGPHVRQLTPWKDASEVYHVFLPAYCEPTQAVFRVHTSAPVTIDGARLESGQSLAQFEPDRDHRLEVGNRSYTLRFTQSANVTTLYIDTQSGSMKAVHADKDNTEAVRVALVTPEGNASVLDGECVIRGRGNSTWVYEKKPYLLNFTEAVDLMGMGAANKWVLLANATDETNLRNKLIYDLAGQMAFLWTPRCEYVDLYLNGEYSGLYLLAERVEIGESRLDIGEDPDSFLCKIDLTDRFSGLENPFMTQWGRAVEITAPENISSAEKNRIVETVQRMEDAILSGEGMEAVLDVDSWIRRLLLDEITENLDGDRASSYFYSLDGRVYAGPIWDYDHIWGSRDRNLNPEALLAKSSYKSEHDRVPYYHALYNDPDVFRRMVQLYESELLPLMQELAEGKILRQAEQIAQASHMNSLRWRHMYDFWQWRKCTPEELAQFLRARLDFLNSAWLEGVEYCTVQVEIGDDLNYLNYVVRPGERFTQLDQVTVPGIDAPVWVDSETGEIFDESRIITRDTRLNLVRETQSGQQEQEALMVAAYMGLLVLGVAAVSWFDNRRCKAKRRSGA